jgi:hypothetical protein
VNNDGEQGGTSRSTANGNSVPDTVLLAQCAVAAGALGKRLTVCLRDYPAYLVAKLLRFFSAEWGGGSVVTVERAAEVFRRRRRQEEGPQKGKDNEQVAASEKASEQFRLYFIRNPRTYSEIAWTFNADLTRADPTSRPAPTTPPIFTTAPVDPDTDPATTLVLHPHPHELELLGNFLGSQKGDSDRVPASSVSDEVMAELGLVFECAVAPVLPRPRDRELVLALWSGALMQTPADLDPIARIAAAYAGLYPVLRGRVARPPDEPTDPLAALMVSRANLYLGFRAETANANKLVATDPARAPDVAGIRVTRVELADLGNVRGARVAALVAWVLARGRFDDFLGLGLKATKYPGDWPNRDVAQLASLLIEWTPKQVRTRFDRLARDGLIGRSRESENGPLLFTLPEVLATRGEGFDRLPPPADVEAALAVSRNEALDCPACPPAAHASGQTELTAV